LTYLPGRQAAAFLSLSSGSLLNDYRNQSQFRRKRKPWRKRIKFIARLLINAAAVIIVSYFLPQLVWVNNLGSALTGGFLLGVLNALIRPVLILLTLPLTIVTLGLFLLVINGFLLWLVSAVVPGFYIHGLAGAIGGSILITIISWFLSHLLL
jgi:putative membrane protein